MIPDFDTDQCVLVMFPRGAGGKLWTNCLGFSTHALFQHSPSVDWTYEQKWQWCKQQFEHTVDSRQWSDLNMTTFSFTGTATTSFTDAWSLSTLASFYKRIQWDPSFCAITRGSKRFFITCHTADQLHFLQSQWPNATSVKMIRAREGLFSTSKPRVREFYPHECALDLFCDGIEEDEMRAQSNFTLNGSAITHQSTFLADLHRLYISLNLYDWSTAQPWCSKFYRTWDRVTDLF